MGNNGITVVNVFSAEAILGSGNSTSEVIPLWAYKPVGNFSLQVESVGVGSVVKLEYLLSNDGVTYLTPAGASDIVTAHAAGNAFYDFTPELAKFLKIKATETAAANVTSLNVKLAIQ